MPTTLNQPEVQTERSHKLLLTAKEAAAMLSLSTRKLWELTNRGQIKAVRIGRAVRYARSSLEQFIADELA